MVVKGQKINDRYQIVRMIGEGGMANVYLAHDIILDRDVAVKILRGDLADDEKFVRRFQREAIAASSLSHPNIVEMYDVGEDDGSYFIVMEYVEGKTLKSLIKRRGSLTIPEVIDIMLQLTSGIACAHDSFIIHRDIKPQNVLILDDGCVKITDFGIAMALNSNELTQTNSVMGSVHYLPPEQANGSGSTIKSDIYSLGILMFELLTGKLPFKGENAVEIAIKQMRDQIPSVCKINPEIPQSIENIVLKACAKNPKNRYESAHEMHEDLKTAMNEERIHEKRVVYEYPEQELEETKKMPSLKEINEEPKKDKKMNKALIITGSIVASLVIILITIFLIIPHVAKTPDVSIPDVSKMSVSKAEKTLKKAGFEVASDVKEKNSDEVEEGKVIGTSPSASRTVKKGSTITLIVSLGKKGITVENYIGQNYNEVKAKLEANGIVVKSIERKALEIDNYEKGVILEQDVKVDTTLVEGDIITFTIPEVLTYPDFVGEAWTDEDVSDFCSKYGIKLTIENEESDLKAGTVIKQSRNAGTEVVSNSTLKVVVAIPKAKTEVEEKKDETEETKAVTKEEKEVNE